MRKRSKKIGKVVSLATTDERRYGAAAGKSRRNLENEMARLGELHAYRHGYAQTSQSKSNINSAHWKDYQNFLRRLDQAVLSQQQIVRDSEQNLALHRQRWLAKRQRLESLRRVLDRYRDEEAAQADRQLQRILDDLPGAKNPYSDSSET